ncbi:MAG TPA: hypothetical protein VGK99_15155 [Acidobacteriota bacterium]|jgi:hypothetical protein
MKGKVIAGLMRWAVYAALAIVLVLTQRSREMDGKTPLNFRIGDTSYLAGTYLVQSMDENKLILPPVVNVPSSVFTDAASIDDMERPEKASTRFRLYGTHRLARIWAGKRSQAQEGVNESQKPEPRKRESAK